MCYEEEFHICEGCRRKNKLFAACICTDPLTLRGKYRNKGVAMKKTKKPSGDRTPESQQKKRKRRRNSPLGFRGRTKW